MEFKLYFTLKEQKEFLIKKGYIIYKVNVFENHSVYHNDVETSQFTIETPSKCKEHPYPTHEKNSIWIANVDTIEKIFRKEFNKAILSI